MPNLDHSILRKLARFEESIMHNVEEKCKNIETEFEEFKASELQNYEDLLSCDNEDAVKHQAGLLRAQNAREFSKAKTDYKKRLYAKREAHRNAIFEKVKENLLAFSASLAYKDFLLSKAAELASVCKEDGTKLLLRGEDLHFATDIQAAFGVPCEVSESKTILLGGILLMNERLHVLADASLDAVFEEQKKEFFNNAQFSIQF
ncbi:MAG: hypothetical protein LBS36_02385 [Oscillospiraceae bacterium]|jgi:vacuolar-type H+-ATPase subunit E/Vma4|nr:hypothetical protein [Oscillospiraceae bacterium]